MVLEYPAFLHGKGDQLTSMAEAELNRIGNEQQVATAGSVHVEAALIAQGEGMDQFRQESRNEKISGRGQTT